MTNDSRIKDIIYKRKNGTTLVNDPEAIKSCKTEQSRDVIDNARLGSYDKYGNYVIIPDIKRELISMPKLVYSTDSVNGSTVYNLKGTIPIFGDVFFKLTLGKSEAKLTVTESVNREAGGYLEVYDEVLDSLPMGNGGLPSAIIFRNYHIIEKPEDWGKRENFSCDNILTRKVYLNLLSKELRKTSTFDEHSAFEKMISTLKTSGEYGKRVLNEFVGRLKDRPAIFEIEQTDHYDKALNEVLLSSVDIATTEADKENLDTRQTYITVLNARNENIDEELRRANSRVDESYVMSIVKKAADAFDNQQETVSEEELADEFFSKLAGQKTSNYKRYSLEKPILKQGKESEEEAAANKAKSKEDKIKDILEKKDGSKKKTPAGKKLKAAKGKNAASKKLKTKGKGKGNKGKAKAKGGKKKNLKKGKVKGKKKKVKKASPAKAKAKGKSFSSKPGGGEKKKKKKDEKKSLHMKMGPLLRQNAVKQAISSNLNIKVAEQNTQQTVVKNENEIKEFVKETPTKRDERGGYLTKLIKDDNELAKESVTRIENRINLTKVGRNEEVVSESTGVISMMEREHSVGLSKGGWSKPLTGQSETTQSTPIGEFGSFISSLNNNPAEATPSTSGSPLERMVHNLETGSPSANVTPTENPFIRTIEGSQPITSATAQSPAATTPTLEE